MECKENRRVERAIKTNVMLNNYRTTMTLNNVTHNELIELKLGLTIEDIIDTIIKIQSEITQENNQNDVLLKELDMKRERELKELYIKHEQTMKMLEIYSANPNAELLNILTKAHVTDVPRDIQETNTLKNQSLQSDSELTAAITYTSFPLPTIPAAIEDIQQFYQSWSNELKTAFDEKRFRKPQWLKCFGKENACTHKLRYEKCYNWLDYLDSLPLSQAQQVIETMTKFSENNNLTHSALIKQVFYLMVRPNSKKPPGMEEQCQKLLNESKLLNVPLPKVVVKQVHKC